MTFSMRSQISFTKIYLILVRRRLIVTGKMIILMVDLHAGWNPNVEHTDVDRSHQGRNDNHDQSGMTAIRYDETDSVDDDLKQQLDLDTPTRYCIESDLRRQLSAGRVDAS
jgi:hypothetical protein